MWVVGLLFVLVLGLCVVDMLPPFDCGLWFNFFVAVFWCLVYCFCLFVAVFVLICVCWVCCLGCLFYFISVG